MQVNANERNETGLSGWFFHKNTEAEKQKKCEAGENDQMKAYLCKITLKGSKPPFWYKCNIPEGISFSSLSIILDKLIGDETEGPFFFEIRQFAKIWEPDVYNPLYSPSFFCSAYDASHTAVDEFLSSGKLLNYSKAGKIFQISLEAVDDHYPFSYPFVVKGSRNTDVYSVIKKLQEEIFLQDRELKRPRGKAQMLAQAKNGIVRIPRIIDGSKENSPYFQASSSRIIRSIADSLRELLPEISHDDKDSMVAEKKDQEPYTTRKILSFYQRNELEELAKMLGVLISKKSLKEDAARLLEETLLNHEFLYRHFISLTDQETAAFEAAMKAGGILKIIDEQASDYQALIDTGYVFYSSDDYILVGTEVMEAYRGINTPEFHEKRKKVSYLRQCLEKIVPLYYSLLPIRKFTRICRRNNDPQIRAEEVPELLSLIPDSMHHCIIKDDAIWTNQLIEDPDALAYIKGVQKDKPYYIMRGEEIDEILQYGYPRNNKAYRRLKEYLLSEMKADPQVIETVLKKIHNLIALSHRVQKFFDTLVEYDIIPTQKQAEEIMNIYMDVVRQTHTMYNRGYTPLDIQRITGDTGYRNICIDDAKITVRKEK